MKLKIKHSYSSFKNSFKKIEYYCYHESICIHQNKTTIIKQIPNILNEIINLIKEE